MKKIYNDYLDDVLYERYNDKYRIIDTDYFPPLIEDCPSIKSMEVHNVFDEKEQDHLITRTLYHSIGIIRQEPQNQYYYHSVVPSARNARSVELYMIVRTKEQYSVFRYNIINEKLELINIKKEKEFEKLIGIVLSDDEMIFLIVGNLWRVHKYYGNFGLSLNMLDAGHLIMQLKLLLLEQKETIEVMYSFNELEILNLISKSSIEFSAHCLIKVKNIKVKYSNIETIDADCIQNKNTNFIKMNSFNKTKHILKYLNKSKRNILYNYSKESELCEYIKKINIYKSSLRRTSAQNPLGLFDPVFQYDRNIFDEIFKDICQGITLLKLHDFLNVYVYIKKVKEMEDGLYILDFERDCVTLLENFKDDLEKNIIHDSHDYINIASIPLKFIISFDREKYYFKYGIDAIRYINYYSGEIAQLISIILAKYKMFCRPMKNMNEIFLKKYLTNKNEDAFYLLLGGNSNISNIYFTNEYVYSK